LPAAITLARRLPAKIELLHVLERDAPQRVHGEPHLVGAAEAERYLHEIAARLEAEGIASTWHVHEVPVGDVPRSIAGHAAESGAALLVLSAHGGGDPRSWLSGAVAQGVIRHAAAPVLLLRVGGKREATAFAPDEITVALDSERQGEAALPAAAALARALDVPLRLLMIVPTAGTMPGDRAAVARLMPSGAAAALDAEAAAAAEYLAAVASRLQSRFADLTVETTVARGDPARAIAAATRSRPSILALATHGRVGLDALWSGSVGARVIARGDGPFLLVHPEPADASPE
jgi:nucleotide-binding universal stress UspA family protein